MNLDYIQNFGYSELYELSNPILYKFGRFVEFDIDNPGKITLAKNKDKIIGVTTCNWSIISDNPNEYPLKYLRDEYGRINTENVIIARGTKQYDEEYEMSYIRTYKDIVEKPVINSQFKIENSYISRLNRNEWVPVNLVGKCIVEDNGECQPGNYCTLYDGDDKELYGIAIPCDKGYYVISRVSKNTILIFYK